MIHVVDYYPTYTSDKGKQTNKQAEVAHAEVWMQGVVQSCVTCRVQYAMHQVCRRALEMHWKSMEFDTQGHTLTSPPSKRVLLVVGDSYGTGWRQRGSKGGNLAQHQGHWPSDQLGATHYWSLAIP